MQSRPIGGACGANVTRRCAGFVISNFTNAIKPPLSIKAYPPLSLSPRSQYENPALTLPKGVVCGRRLCVMNRYLQAMLLVWVIKYQQSGDKRNLSQLPPRYISDPPVGLLLGVGGGCPGGFGGVFGGGLHAK